MKSSFKKFGPYFIAGAGIIVILLIFLLFFAPRIIRLEGVKEKIQAGISQRLEGQFEFQGINLSYFPRPRLEIIQGSFTLAGEVTGALESMTLYPEILPLLLGRFKIGSVEVYRPILNIGLPKRPPQNKGMAAFPFTFIQEKLASLLAFAGSEVSGFDIMVEKGRLNLLQENTPVFWFQDIQSRVVLPSDQLIFDLTGKSNLWESFSLKGQFNMEGLKGTGQGEVKQLRPHLVSNYFLPHGGQYVVDSQVNLNFRFDMAGEKLFRADVKGGIPFVTFQMANGPLVLKGRELEGSFSFDGIKTRLTLAALTLDYPQLKFSGEFTWDESTGLTHLELDGREVEVHSTREVALTLLGRYKTTQEIFSYVRGGQVPRITFKAEGSSMADLLEIEKIEIRGSIDNGQVFVSEAGLNLEGVKGEVIISQGMLEGKRLEARLSTSSGHDGILKIGLAGHDHLFHLDVLIRADLAALPPVLNGVVKNEAFLKGLGYIKDVEGSAVGRLILGESTKSIKAQVEVSEFNLRSHYRLIPYPVEIKEGEFSYKRGHVTLRNLKGRVGESTFSRLSAQVDWEKQASLEVKISQGSKISLDEIHPWLLSIKGFKETLKSFQSVKGLFILKGLDLKGPLFRPEKWDFRIAGDWEKGMLKADLFPGVLTLAGGKLEAFPKKLSFANFKITMMDTSMNVSGVLEGYLKGFQAVNLTLQGDMGPEAVEWAVKYLRLPEEFRPRPPLSISKAHLVWNRDVKTSFLGALTAKAGTKVDIDILVSPEELVIKDLRIEDEESHALIRIGLKEKEWALNLVGNLNKSTLDKLLERNLLLDGWIKGNFQGNISLDKPMNSTVQGKLEGGGIDHIWKIKAPVRIETLSLDASENRLKIESAILKWRDSLLAFEGNIDFSEAGFLLDMDLSVDSLEWEKIEKALETNHLGKAQGLDNNFLGVPLEGKLRVKSQIFKWGSIKWNPFQAEVSFNRDGVSVAASEANWCGVLTPGVLKIASGQLIIVSKPFSQDQDLDSSLTCLWEKKGLMNGVFDLSGELILRGKKEELRKSLHGHLEFTAHEGRIYRFGVLSKIFAVLNVTEIFRGKLPDLVQEGFAYHSIKVEGHFRDGVLHLKEVNIDGSSMRIVAQGDIELAERKMNLTVLVAPFKTLDFIIRNIPIVGEILGGSLISIPIQVKGDLTDPAVIPLSPSAVGSGLLGVMKRTLQFPFKIIQPLVPDEEFKEPLLIPEEQTEGP